jgi:hypothetical protein
MEEDRLKLYGLIMQHMSVESKDEIAQDEDYEEWHRIKTLRNYGSQLAEHIRLTQQAMSMRLRTWQLGKLTKTLNRVASKLLHNTV